MKIKTLVAVLLLSGGVTSVLAQEDCNKNSSISHEAVRANNFKDAYLPWKEVLKDCPTLRYYTYTDGIKILTSFLNDIKDRNSADYKKYFDELMEVFDLRMKYTPDFMHLKGTPSVGDVLGNKAINYIAYAPNIDVNQAYAWLKESLETEKGGSKGPILHYFLDMSLNKLKADPNHKEQFIQDYLTDSEYADAAIAAEDDAKKKAALWKTAVCHDYAIIRCYHLFLFLSFSKCIIRLPPVWRSKYRETLWDRAHAGNKDRRIRS